jgi:hypothetical protein
MATTSFFQTTIAQGSNQDQNLINGRHVTIDIKSVVMFSDAGNGKTFLSLLNGASITIAVEYNNFKEVHLKSITMK